MQKKWWYFILTSPFYFLRQKGMVSSPCLLLGSLIYPSESTKAYRLWWMSLLQHTEIKHSFPLPLVWHVYLIIHITYYTSCSTWYGSCRQVNHLLLSISNSTNISSNSLSDHIISFDTSVPLLNSHWQLLQPTSQQNVQQNTLISLLYLFLTLLSGHQTALSPHNHRIAKTLWYDWHYMQVIYVYPGQKVHGMGWRGEVKEDLIYKHIIIKLNSHTKIITTSPPLFNCKTEGEFLLSISASALDSVSTNFQLYFPVCMSTKSTSFLPMLLPQECFYTFSTSVTLQSGMASLFKCSSYFTMSAACCSSKCLLFSSSFSSSCS